MLVTCAHVYAICEHIEPLFTLSLVGHFIACAEVSGVHVSYVAT